MPPREVIRLGNLEKTLILANYRQNGAMWDVIINEISRNPRFAQLPGNLQDMYRNVAHRNALRRRIREYIRREQRQ